MTDEDVERRIAAVIAEHEADLAADPLTAGAQRIAALLDAHGEHDEAVMASALILAQRGHAAAGQRLLDTWSAYLDPGTPVLQVGDLVVPAAPSRSRPSVVAAGVLAVVAVGSAAVTAVVLGVAAAMGWWSP